VYSFYELSIDQLVFCFGLVMLMQVGNEAVSVMLVFGREAFLMPVILQEVTSQRRKASIKDTTAATDLLFSGFFSLNHSKGQSVLVMRYNSYMIL
jgi:predicted membrane protein